MRQAIAQEIQYETENAGIVRPKTSAFSKQKRSSLYRLLGYSLKYKSTLYWAILSLFLSSLSLAALPFIIGKIVDSISKEEDRDRLNYYVVMLLILFSIGAIFGSIRSYCFNQLGELTVLRIRNDLFSKLILKDIEFFDNNRSGELISRLTSDVTLLQSASSDSISGLIRNMASCFASLVFLFVLSWKLTLLFLGIVPICCGCAMIFIKQYKTMTIQYQQKLAISTQVAQECIQNIRVVKSFSMEDEEQNIYQKSTLAAFEIGKKKSYLIGAFTGVGMMVGNISIMSVLYYGGTLVLQGDMTIGNLSSFILYTMSLAIAVLQVSGTLNVIITATAVSEKLFELMDHKVTITDGKFVPKNFQNITGAIELKNVNFEYPSKINVQVLKDFTININAGEVIAFVGHSGGGKSTIISLLQRFYDPTFGKISFDGTDLKDFNLKFIHQQIGYVPQEPTLFSGTLLENIRYGKRDATEEQVLQAMKQAHVYEFVTNTDQFPDGIQTIVGERGIKLSGGQKQRVAIARALLKDPKVLIFDEATSALDAESEHQVQQAIEELMKSGSKTIIIIAHRLSTIMNCQLIAVLEQGRICELGTHNELLRANGVYKSLIERQLSKNL